MSQTFSYTPGPFNLGQLSDELVAGGVVLEYIRGNETLAEVTVGDAVLQAAVDAIVSAHVADYRLPWEKDLDAHEADSDPHPTYLTAAEGNAAYDAAGAASGAVSAHEAASDPHTGYQKESEKGAASGYASLDAGTKVPTAQLASGTADATTFLRGDQTWATPSAGGGVTDGDKGDITVSGGGSTWTIDNGVVETANLGGDITMAGRALLDDADAAAQRATLGLGTAATQASSAFEPAGAIASHEAASDPHPGYLTTAEGNAAYDAAGAATAAVNAHVAGSDPHTQYQKESEKGAANGYAELGSGGYVPTGQLASGTADNTKFLRGDQTWATPAGGVSDGDKGDITVTGSGATWTIDAGVVTTTKMGGDVTAAGRAILDDADAAAQRTTLGLGTAATSNTGDFAAAVHTHSALAITTGTIDTARLGSGSASASVFLRGDQTWAAPTDAWTEVLLTSDFSTTSATAVNVTGLAFTPAANKSYIVECYFLLRTATATVGPRPGFAYPTGLTDAGSFIEAPNSATTSAVNFSGGATAGAAISTGVPNTTASWFAYGKALLVAGASPSGNFQVTLTSETAGTSVTMKAKSVLLYREV